MKLGQGGVSQEYLDSHPPIQWVIEVHSAVMGHVNPEIVRSYHIRMYHEGLFEEECPFWAELLPEIYYNHEEAVEQLRNLRVVEEVLSR